VGARSRAGVARAQAPTFLDAAARRTWSRLPDLAERATSPSRRVTRCVRHAARTEGHRRVNARHPTEQPGGTQTAARTAPSKLLPSFLPRHDPELLAPGRVVSGLGPRMAGGSGLVLARRGSHAFARPSSGSAAPSSASPVGSKTARTPRLGPALVFQIWRNA
jgi:hypothetical protein